MSSSKAVRISSSLAKSSSPRDFPLSPHAAPTASPDSSPSSRARPRPVRLASRLALRLHKLWRRRPPRSALRAGDVGGVGCEELGVGVQLEFLLRGVQATRRCDARASLGQARIAPAPVVRRPELLPVRVMLHKLLTAWVHLYSASKCYNRRPLEVLREHGSTASSTVILPPTTERSSPSTSTP